ncbi:MAG: hypothetical protein OXC40_01585 [Proteobacteria bacterium]|nr:hypothetical protein [Pseudomonadota bacterium]
MGNMVATQVVVKVPGKVMLAGEYAILFGLSDALACSLSCYLTVTCKRVCDLNQIAPGMITVQSDLWHEPKSYQLGALLELTSSTAMSLGRVFYTLYRLLTELKENGDNHTHVSDYHYHMTIGSQIPLMAGFGSSSALKLAVLFGFVRCAGLSVKDQMLLSIAYQSQADFQGGFASGYDVLVQYYGGLVTSSYVGAHQQVQVKHHQRDAKIITALNQHFHLFSQEHQASPTGPLISHVLPKILPSFSGDQIPLNGWSQNKQRFDRRFLEIASCHQDMIDMMTVGDFSDKLMMTMKQCRQLTCDFLGHDQGNAILSELEDKLADCAGLDQTFSFKSTGAGGLDALLFVGQIPAEAVAILRETCYYRSPYVFTTDFLRVRDVSDHKS